MTTAETGLEVVSIAGHASFAQRHVHHHSTATQMEAMHRIAVAFVEEPDNILQELVNAAVELCGADSAGISIEREAGTEKDFYKWVATAGVYTPFLNASLPKRPSACTICLERNEPQLFRVHKEFFDTIGVKAALVKDGLLLPWDAGDRRGTIFIIAHDRAEAFDEEDLRLMKVLAGFAALGVKQQRLQRELLARTRDAAAAAMAHELAHQINNPLQALTNMLYLADKGTSEGSERTLARKMSSDFQRLSKLVKRLLELPKQAV